MNDLFSLGRQAFLEIDRHDGEEEKDHDGAGVDDDLDDGDKRCIEEAEDPAERGEREDQEKGVIGLVPGNDHGHNGADAEEGEENENNPGHGGLRPYIKITLGLKVKPEFPGGAGEGKATLSGPEYL